MGPFDFLKSTQRGLEQYFQPARGQVKNTIEQFFPSRSLNFRLDKSPKAPNILSLISKSQQQQQPQPMAGQFQQSPLLEDYTQAQVQPQQQIEPLLALLVLLALQGGGSSYA